MHELGHVIGLEHISKPNSLMAPTLAVETARHVPIERTPLAQKVDTNRDVTVPPADVGSVFAVPLKEPASSLPVATASLLPINPDSSWLDWPSQTRVGAPFTRERSALSPPVTQLQNLDDEWDSFDADDGDDVDDLDLLIDRRSQQQLLAVLATRCADPLFVNPVNSPKGTETSVVGTERTLAAKLTTDSPDDRQDVSLLDSMDVAENQGAAPQVARSTAEPNGSWWAALKDPHVWLGGLLAVASFGECWHVNTKRRTTDIGQSRR
jgi:hypothetical protein